MSDTSPRGTGFAVSRQWHPLARAVLLLGVLALAYFPWLPFPWRMPAVGLLGVLLVWLETRSTAAAGLRRCSVAATIGWTLGLLLIVVAVLDPLLEPAINWLTGTPTDYSAYGALKGNRDAALALIGGAWLSAALGEELVFRAFLLHQLAALWGRSRLAMPASVILGGAVFGLMHAAQGVSGVLLTGCVGMVFSYAYFRSNRNLLAMVLAHGLIDTWGVGTLYLGWY